jgi:hypothetical protein
MSIRVNRTKMPIWKRRTHSEKLAGLRNASPGQPQHDKASLPVCSERLSQNERLSFNATIQGTP